MPGRFAAPPDPPRADSAVVPVDVVDLTRALVRIDSTTPEGEAACVRHVAAVAAGLGADIRLVGEPARPCLVARFGGAGLRPPLLVQGHVDVVPVTGQRWTADPFGADLVDGVVWGRGTVDMKGHIAMAVAALSRLVVESTLPAGDVVLALVPDEESGSDAGARLLVRQHPELFDGIAHGVGEDGGASLDLGGGARTHPVVVGEKRACWLRIVLRGPGGHGSRVAPQGSPVRALGTLLHAVRGGGLPARLDPAVRTMLGEAAAVASQAVAAGLRRFLTDPDDPAALDPLPERDRQYLRSVSRDTVNVTVVRGGTSVNVLPEEIELELDARLLPGGDDVDVFLDRLRAHSGLPLDAVEVIDLSAPVPAPRTGPFYDALTGVLRAGDPGGVPLPMMTTAATDGPLFASLGIHHIGWVPLLPEKGTDFRGLLHAADERIPVRALRFGEACFADLYRRTW